MAGLVWRADAEKMMEKVPSFVRSMARRAVEEYARKAGSSEVTSEQVLAVQEEYFGFIGKRRPADGDESGHHGARHGGSHGALDSGGHHRDHGTGGASDTPDEETTAEGTAQDDGQGPLRIAVVRCHTVAEVCPGVACFMAFNRRKVHFKQYGPETEMIGFFTCGGCSGRRVARLVESLKKFDLDVVHMSSCMIMHEGYPPCPFRAQIKKTILDKGVRVVEGTHH